MEMVNITIDTRKITGSQELYRFGGSKICKY